MEPQLEQKLEPTVGITAQPSPEMAMEEDLIDMEGGGEMTPDEAAAALAFATKISEMMNARNNPQVEQPLPDEPTEEQSGAPEEITPTENLRGGDIPLDEPIEEETEKPEVDVEAITKKIDELQSTHEKEVQAMKSEIKDESMRRDYEKKIGKLEEKHNKAIEALKKEIKDILNEAE